MTARAVRLSRNSRALVALGLVLILLWPLYQLRNDRQQPSQPPPLPPPLHDDQQSEPMRPDPKEEQPPLPPGEGHPPPSTDTSEYNNTLYHGGDDSPVHPYSAFSSPCDGFPDLDNIMFVMKTGATEAFDKVPTQLLTSLQCIDDFLIFSDLEQQIGKYHIYNVLDRVADSVKKAHSEFELYQAQLDCPISQQYCTKDMDGGWPLDKFKFLNIIARTWEMRPDKKWYVFGEADTYIVWNSLVHFLREMINPKEYPYVGSVALFSGFSFAHGGSGYIISGETMKKMVEDIPNLAAKYDDKTDGECCGDVMIARAAQEVSVQVKQAHPMINGEKPNTLRFGPDQWCEPILTMHHMNPEEVSAMWQYEQTRIGTDFVQIKDLYKAFFAPKLVPARSEWDNLYDGTCYISPDKDAQGNATEMMRKKQKKEGDKSIIEKAAHTSASACARVCESDGLFDPDKKTKYKGINAKAYKAADGEQARDEILAAAYKAKLEKDPQFPLKRRCFQWRYHSSGVCCTAPTFTLGVPRRGKDGDGPEWTSGWFVRGINDWIEQRGECPVQWKKPVILG